jgi:hypothetical protein
MSALASSSSGASAVTVTCSTTAPISSLMFNVAVWFTFSSRPCWVVVLKPMASARTE